MTDDLTGAALTVHSPRPSALGSPGGAGPAVPDPLCESVGDILGLAPRRARGDGGEVAAADVDLVDALPRGPGSPWATVAGWLQEAKAVTTRRARLADTAAFLRWLAAAAPGFTLLTATEDVIVSYRDQIASATGAARELLRGGRPLSPATIARRRAHLSSFYEYAVRRHVLGVNPAQHVRPPEVSSAGVTPGLQLADATKLLGGAEAIAGEYPADAAAVALLCVGVRTGEVERVEAGRFAEDAGHRVIRFTVKGGKVIAVPLPARIAALVDPVLDGLGKHDVVIRRDDGRPFDRWRMTTAVRRAARAAGIPHKKITPHWLRVTAATLLLDAGVPIDKVQTLLGHASPVTTKRYDRGGDRLDGHAAYRLASILSGGS